ncbi:MAG: DUF4296 domain-containing protein [Bacteroidetes bacterium]|nr:DUF4296 domain-containing protein [Bacteroidota bacterium]
MKQNAAFFILSLMPLIFSCSSPDRPKQNESLPADSVISEKKMMALLVDVHLLEGGLMILRNKGEQDGKWSHDAYRKLFLRYRITESQFKRNLDYYQKDPKTFAVIYDTVIQRLDRLRKTPLAKPNVWNKSKKPASVSPHH